MQRRLDVILNELPTRRLWLAAIGASLLLSELVVAAMSLLLEGRLSPAFLLAGLVTSLLVAAPVVGLLVRFAAGLRESEALLKQSQQVAQVGHYVYDVTAGSWTSSAALDGIFGIDAGYVRDVPGWLALVHPEEREAMAAYLRDEVLGRGVPFDREYRVVRHEDGAVRWVHGYGDLARDAAGRPLRMFGVIRDDTQRKAAELALQDNLRFATQLIEVIPGPVFYKDRDDRYLGCNAAFERFIGKAREEIVGRTPYDLAPRELAERYHAADMALFENPGTQVYQASVRGADGALRQVVFHKATFSKADGSLGGLVGLILDITELKCAEDALQRSLDDFNNLVTRVPVGVFKFRTVAGGVSRFDYVSPRWCEMVELAAEDVYRDSQVAFARAHPEDLPGFLEQMKVAIRNRAPFEWEGRLLAPRGERWLHVVASPTVLEGGDILWEGIQYDITERKQVETRLRLAASVFENAHEGICVTDAEERIVEVNATFCELTGYRREQAIGETPRLLKSGHQTPEFYAGMWRDVADRGHWQGELWNRRPGGEIYAVRLTISAVRDEQERITHYVGVFSDITATKENERRLERIAHYDPLTNIPNRALLADRIRQAIAQTHRSRSLLAICYLDLDGFKAINDTYGHEAGDKLLVEVASRLHGCLRGGDTVARLGGDEFVLLLLGLDRKEECEIALDRTLEEIAAPVDLGKAMVAISASVGVVLYPQDDSEPEALLRHADQAMYRAKQAGKNRYAFYAN